MTAHRWHWPQRGPQSPNAAVGIMVESPNTCGGCGRRIVFVEGYELRREYWRAIRG